VTFCPPQKKLRARIEVAKFLQKALDDMAETAKVRERVRAVAVPVGGAHDTVGRMHAGGGLV
jgi:hypothetical protein